MKKTITSILAVAMCSAMSVTAFATDTIIENNGSATASVTATYQAGSSAGTVYSVDVSWGSMEFTYTSASDGAWDPETHTNSGSTEAAWSCDTNANKITVTNHSNVDIVAYLSYTAENTYSSISGSFTESSSIANDGSLYLYTAEDTEVANAPTASATLNLSGALGTGVSNTKIGSVTVEIEDIS